MKTAFLRSLLCSGILLVASVEVNRAQAPGPPTGLRSQVSGNVVTVAWDAAPLAASYRVQVGTSPGGSNVFNGSVGNATSGSGTLGDGVYFWRVIAVGPSGTTSAPSAEAQFTVPGGGPCAPPGPPQNLTSSVNGSRVTLRWSAPASGDAPTTYFIEAGSSPGLANLYNAPTGSTATEIAVDAPDGRYYVRLRAQNRCGTSGVSNERVIDVPDGPQPCSYTVSPTSANVSAAGGVFEVRIDTASGCRWRVSSDSWIVPSAGPTGSGGATIGYAVMASTGPRTGAVVVEGLDPSPFTAARVNVTQSAGCVYTVTPSSRDIPGGGGTFTFNVTTSAGCTWSASSGASWIGIVSGGNGNGSGTVNFSVAANTGAARSSHVRIEYATGRQDMPVSQAVNPPPVASFSVSAQPCPVIDNPANPGGSSVLNCSFDGSASTSGSAITSYRWDIGALTSTSSNPVLSGRNVGCGFGDGTFELPVTLTVRDALGRESSVSQQVRFRKDSGC